MTLIKFKNSDRFPFMPAMNQFFTDFMNSDLMEKNVFQSVPSVNITETPEKFMVELAAPGMKKEDFKVSVEKDVLTIKAEKKEEKSDVNSRFTRREFSYSSFSRSFTLPEMISTDSISAEYDSGVLKLHIPKKEEVKQNPAKEIVVS